MRELSVFDEVRERISTTEAARYYGYEPNRAGFICCPFHKDRTPSLRLYPDGFYCFGCGAGGSVIDFVGRLFHLVAEARKLFAEWRERMLLQINAAIRKANTADPEQLTGAEALAVRYRETLENWGDQLSNGRLSEQMEIFRDREEVERLCRTILNSTPMKSQVA